MERLWVGVSKKENVNYRFVTGHELGLAAHSCFLRFIKSILRCKSKPGMVLVLERIRL